MTPSAESRDAHATANTLNRALGSRHVKAWMNSASDTARAAPPNIVQAIAPVRKRGRPRKYPLPDIVHQQHATQQVHRPNNVPAERLPSSNSTSPQPANTVITPGYGLSGSHVPVTAFPSPTPSEEDPHSREITAGHLEHPVQQDVPLPRGRADEGQAPVEKRPRVDSAPMSQVTATAGAPEMMSPAELPLFPDFLRRPSASHSQQGNHSSEQALSRSHSFQQVNFPALVQRPHHLRHPQSAQGDPPPIQDEMCHVLFARQTQPSVTNEERGPAVIFETGIAQNAQSQTSPADGWYSPEVYQQLLQSFDHKILAARVGRSPLDTHRFHLLQEAVMAQDWTYLTLHQHYCVMTFSPHLLSLELQRSQHSKTAYHLMQEVLSDNSQLTKPFRQFFCEFPFPKQYLASELPTKHHHAHKEFISFVNNSPFLAGLRHECQRRRAPPIPLELTRCGVFSPTFQKCLFRLIVRAIWVAYPSSPLKSLSENKASQAFEQARMRYYQSPAGSFVDVSAELRRCSGEFTQITTALEAALRAQDVLSLGSTLPHAHPQERLPLPHAHTLPLNAPATAYSHQQQQQYQQPQYPQQQQPLLSPQAMSRHARPQTQFSPRDPQGSTALLPRHGVVQPTQRVPNPPRFSLHQAHLRSPTLQTSRLSPAANYFWQGFVVKPQRVMNANNAIERLSFDLSEKELESLAKSLPVAVGAVENRAIDEGHRMIRLRCVKWPSDESPQDHNWAIAPNSWIRYSHFTFNDVPLQLRKKLHHGKDLPVDLTGLVRAGRNVLEVSIMSNASDITHQEYLIAIEYLGVLSDAHIIESCQKQAVSAQETISDIKRKLCSSDTNDDDDIVMVESTLTINLLDPFSASKIYSMPVRGHACLHNECFDLETFLKTRPRKADVTAADHWLCPICKADARPNMLFVVEFLVDVLKELETRGLPETRSIIVDKDGRWEPKPEERDPNGVQDHDTPEPVPAARSTIAQSTITPAHEIIELDSD